MMCVPGRMSSSGLLAWISQCQPLDRLLAATQVGYMNGESGQNRD